jgi:hypothetical protein
MKLRNTAINKQYMGEGGYMYAYKYVHIYTCMHIDIQRFLLAFEVITFYWLQRRVPLGDMVFKAASV